MKMIIMIIAVALIQLMGTAQTKSSAKTETVEFTVLGNCGMCKSRIEKALKVEGVESAKWDAKKNIATVVYQPAKIKEEKLHNLVASAGHDTELVLAKNETYDKLHGCCKYERKEIVNKQQKKSETHKH
jgi:copper chaperone CopZ